MSPVGWSRTTTTTTADNGKEKSPRLQVPRIDSISSIRFCWYLCLAHSIGIERLDPIWLFDRDKRRIERCLAWAVANNEYLVFPTAGVCGTYTVTTTALHWRAYPEVIEEANEMNQILGLEVTRCIWNSCQSTVLITRRSHETRRESNKLTIAFKRGFRLLFAQFGNQKDCT